MVAFSYSKPLEIGGIVTCLVTGRCYIPLYVDDDYCPYSLSDSKQRLGTLMRLSSKSPLLWALLLVFLPVLAQAQEHSVLVEHLKSEFLGYAVAVSLMLWTLCELRKETTSETNNRSPASFAFTTAFQTLRDAITKAVGWR